MIIGKITSKSQTTVPKAVREALGLEPGDEVIWEIDAGGVRLVKIDLDDSEESGAPDMFMANFSTFTEWDS